MVDDGHEATLAQLEGLREEARGALPICPPVALELFAKVDNLEGVWLRKLDNLGREPEQFGSIRRCRRDGNCFYRSYFFGLFAGMAEDFGLREKMRALLKESLHYCEQAGYEKYALEDMHEEVMNMVQSLFPDACSPVEIGCVEKIFREEEMNYSICYLRCLTSSYMKLNVEEFEPFLTQHKSIAEFCAAEVDPLWREADQLQIQALVSYLRVPICIYYLDQSEGEQCQKYEMLFEDQKSKIDFLYRPGHYELLYR